MIRGISEIVLVVTDVLRSAAFYESAVGLVLEMPPTPEWAWFRCGPPEAPQRLGLRRGALLFEERSPRPAGQRWGAVHFALNVPRQDLADHIVRLRTAGAEVLGPTRFDWMRAESVYAYDPDGNLVELWSPDP